MYIKVDFTVSGLQLTKWEKPLAVEVSQPFPVIVELKTPDDREIEIGFSKESLLGSATGKIDVPKNIKSMFQCLTENKLPKSSVDLSQWSDFLEADGRLKKDHIPPLALLPSEMKEFIGEIKRILWNILKRVVRVIRWRHGIRGSHSPFASRGSEWSLDGNSWHPTPYSGSVYLEDSTTGINRLTFNEFEIAALVDARSDEPIGHELFREAWEQRHSNPRSSLVIGMAALEAGLKHYIASVAPDSRWLVENAPSPPLPSMLKNYLVELPAKCSFDRGVLPPPKPVLAHIRRGMELRNKTAHVGKAAPAINELDEILLAVKDVLWMLDYYSGHKWALDRMRPDLREELSHIAQKT